MELKLVKLKDEDNDNEKNNTKSNIIAKKAKELSQSGKDLMSEGVTKSKEIKKKIEKKAATAVKEIDSKAKRVKTDIQDGVTKAVLTGMKVDKNFLSDNTNKSFDKRIEDQIFSWYGWIWSIIAFAFIILISFAISLNDNRFSTLPIILSIAFPIYIFWIIYNAIPEVKIGNTKIFSRDDISLRKQLSFGKAVAKTFSREMIKNSPEGALLIGFFLLLFIYIVVSPFF